MNKLSIVLQTNDQPSDHRKIQRICDFDMETIEATSDHPTYIVLDQGYLTIKNKIGEGGFCKVKACTALVNRKNVEELV